MRPLVLYRSFHGAFRQYAEIDEEFRLYHDLAEDRARGLLLSFDASGREIEVVRITSNEVRARLKHLRQFQAGTGLHLAIFLDSIRYSEIPLADIPANERGQVETDGMVRWRRNVVECDFKPEYQTFSRVLCKVILAPPPPGKAGVWPFKDDDDQRAVAFIIGVDEEGNEIEHNSDPATLSNYFGANPGEPHYLTPVYFRREVLAKVLRGTRTIPSFGWSAKLSEPLGLPDRQRPRFACRGVPRRPRTRPPVRRATALAAV